MESGRNSIGFFSLYGPTAEDYLVFSSTTCTEYGGTVWLNFRPTPESAVFIGTIRLGSRIVGFGLTDAAQRYQSAAAGDGGLRAGVAD
jgi:hypothetical protein